MIVFDLKCENNHQFESWFRSSSAYEEQKQAGLVTCPTCDSGKVSKAPMAPNVSAKANQTRTKEEPRVDEATPGTAPPVAAPKSGHSVTPAAMSGSLEMERLIDQASEVITKLQKHVEDNCDNVGDQFAEEARKIHYGEAKSRGIYGNASIDDAKELVEEGIDVMPLPTLRRTDA